MRMRTLISFAVAVIILPISASGSPNYGHRMVMRRYATVGTIQESDQSLGVVKDLANDRTYYLRVGDNVPGSNRLIVKRIQNRKVTVVFKDSRKSVVLPVFSGLNVAYKVDRHEIDDNHYHRIVTGCREDASNFCDDSKSDQSSTTLQCLVEQVERISSTCASQIRLLRK